MAETFTIRIIKTPAGPAPEEIRASLVGLEMPAKKLPLWVMERDFATGRPIGNRMGIAVETETFLRIVGTRSEEAANRYFENIPPGMPYATFDPTEVEVV